MAVPDADSNDDVSDDLLLLFHRLLAKIGAGLSGFFDCDADGGRLLLHWR